MYFSVGNIEGKFGLVIYVYIVAKVTAQLVFCTKHDFLFLELWTPPLVLQATPFNLQERGSGKCAYDDLFCWYAIIVLVIIT